MSVTSMLKLLLSLEEKERESKKRMQSKDKIR
jgi:hypothetical protein